MYGVAGWQYTAGFPKLGKRLKAVKGKGVSRERQDKPKYDKANQANARRLGVRP